MLGGKASKTCQLWKVFIFGKIDLQYRFWFNDLSLFWWGVSPPLCCQSSASPLAKQVPLCPPVQAGSRVTLQLVPVTSAFGSHHPFSPLEQHRLSSTGIPSSSQGHRYILGSNCQAAEVPLAHCWVYNPVVTVQDGGIRGVGAGGAMVTKCDLTRSLTGQQLPAHPSPPGLAAQTVLEPSACQSYTCLLEKEWTKEICICPFKVLNKQNQPSNFHFSSPPHFEARITTSCVELFWPTWWCGQGHCSCFSSPSGAYWFVVWLVIACCFYPSIHASAPPSSQTIAWNEPPAAQQLKGKKPVWLWHWLVEFLDYQKD